MYEGIEDWTIQSENCTKVYRTECLSRMTFSQEKCCHPTDGKQLVGVGEPDAHCRWVTVNNLTLTPQQVLLQQITNGNHQITRVPVTLNNLTSNTLVDIAASHNFVLIRFIDISKLKQATQVLQLTKLHHAGETMGSTTITVRICDVETTTTTFVSVDYMEMPY
ncbi:hypothetical protein PR048_030868 [Dryococelus australis]|uniref:Uncharacterized protein n=1 Tax=Dryococelus australis TaxID=614101 RepID=A0ABQ9GDY5_9NEOP|nr:hypothetical protein PR048_030868 [Dryococelus australis]